MDDHKCFSVETTAATIQKRGALAIYYQRPPRRHDDGSNSISLRLPLLLMPPGVFRNSDEIMARIARILNESASEFHGPAPEDGE